ncbi:hypothetical protein ACLMJK_006158 [Lecanora helva]
MSTSPTPEEREKKDMADRAREAEEQAKLPYKWTQTIQDLDITVSVPGNLKGKDIVVEMKKTSLKVGVKGHEPVIDGPLPHEIHPSESTWTLEPAPSSTKEISIHLDKTNKMQWWASVTTNSPYFLDTSKIQPENSKLGDLDGETRGMVEKMMYDQRQKEMGKPTSDEARKMEMLEGFKKQHPEMDFSNARMS